MSLFGTRIPLLIAAFCLVATTAFAQPADGSAFIELGIVEVENPAEAPCPDPFDAGGCDEFDGNTVWHDPNVVEDYYLSAGGGEGGVDRLSRYVEAAAPYTYELRFTDEGGVGVYAFSTDFIASVPFELWNIGVVEPGTENDPADDFRMIPFLNANADEADTWADNYTGTDPWPDGPGSEITDWIYWMAPQNQSGSTSYDNFEAAAMSVGGPGNIYPWDDPKDNTCDDGTGVLVDCDGITDDGDDVINVNPLTGENCGLEAGVGPLNGQGYYVDFCYRNQESFFGNGELPSEFIYPIGRLVVGDFAGDGSTPPSGTTIRIYTEGGTLSTQDDLAVVNGFAFKAAYPNPIVASAVVPFDLDEAGVVRVAAYDVLGREVAVLVDEARAAGSYADVTFEAAGLPNGLYVLRAEFGGAVTSQKVLVVR